MTDRQLQEHVLNALDWEPSVDAADIGVSVVKGMVTMRGDVMTYAERAAAERVALAVHGTKAVANDINVRLGNGRKPSDSDVGQAVLLALRWSSVVPEGNIAVSVTDGGVWSAEVDARRINVSATDGKVVLSGNVHSWFERTEAGRAAWAGPGVQNVEDRTSIVP